MLPLLIVLAHWYVSQLDGAASDEVNNVASIIQYFNGNYYIGYINISLQSVKKQKNKTKTKTNKQTKQNSSLIHNM